MHVALVGYGGFGRALCSLLDAAGLSWRALDPWGDIPEPHRVTSFPELVSGADLVVVAVPVPRLRSVLEDMRPHLRPTQLVLDVGSVKVRPVEVMAEVLGSQVPWVGTHPLFGPRSLAKGERPLRVVVCPNALHPEATARARRFYEQLGCEVLEQSAEVHDRVMANTHVLTFFVARGMVEAETAENVPFAPASFQSLARTIDTVRADAGHLFATIQRENPFAREARQLLLDALQTIHRQLDDLPAEEGSPREGGRLDFPSSKPGAREEGEDVDALDRELVALLARRVELARRTSKSAAREEALLASRRAWATELGLDEEGVDGLFRALLRVSKRSASVG